MPRLVRRTPLLERMKAYLDPYDLLLWFAEELNDDVYDEWLQAWATPIGVAFNIIFILARGASKAGQVRSRDDVFGEAGSSGWLAWFATFLVHSLTLLCCINTLFTFLRRRNYRLFEQPVDVAPATPSAHRVRVDSSPMSSSPLRYLRSVIDSVTSRKRGSPDAEREVWELALWDPKPFNLTLFTLFSPGHLLLYCSLLPPARSDTRPSVTVATALGFGALLSLQLMLLKYSFSQQSKDATLVHGEVMNEYDTKFVRPSLNRPVRDVGTQTRESTTSPRGVRTREVDVYTPTTIVNRGFRTNPNPNYARHFDPDNQSATEEQRTQRAPAASLLATPNNGPYVNGSVQSSYFRPSAYASASDFSSPLKPHHERSQPSRGDGGSMGIYSHAASPMRKAADSNHLRPATNGAPVRQGSPLKRMNTPGGALGANRDSAVRRDTGRF
ncbi:hypothetical protein BAUCODRAFT_37311 [Baudoinia panamericana UAMH 10762]|uniref:Nuclear rim protein 1 n=1 Tax=Baudoinia panamericana (strain UAMH 10762) TaxID=717646 RepID=M2MAY6_BAUPA|nr:uncharacterized protein BAUCODRAFT_37311 [Baudoinia panamericana UAMH 10762]EMC93626.1 hypothetical protein BAUCODRAFT_37311 [Baudoinia panamericana UAMH 10762]